MIAADIYDVKNHNKLKRQRKNKSSPFISVLIPAYNEELTIEKTVRSAMKSQYKNREIIVINDGSKDNTKEVVKNIQSRFPRTKLKLINQRNAGKGAALNQGIAKAKGELIMVLDADSEIDTYAIKNSIKYFDDKKVKAVASNVKLEDNGTWTGLMQRLEYLLSYRMKRSLTTLNIEYIIGGVGSVYRASTLKQVSGYRENTITEDIDLSMKVVARGNKAYRVVYAADVHTSTEAVHSFKELISQRYRWKFGRMQAFIRYRNLFLSKNKKHGKMLSWFQLPYAIFGELYLVMEPLFIFTIIFVTVVYLDSSALPLAMTILIVFMALNIIAANKEKLSQKIALVYLLPVMYFMLPVLAFVELVSLVKTIKNWKELTPKRKTHGGWVHVARKPLSSKA